MVRIVPAILTQDEQELWSQVARVKGLVERIQIDIVDGVFAIEKTVDPEILLGREGEDGLFDLHLMVREPERWVDRLEGGKWGRVIGQVELMKNQSNFIADIQAQGWGVGLGVDIDTGVEVIREWVDDVDCILLMGVKAGHQGQKFDERVLEKIEMLRSWSKSVDIIIDGGLDETVIKKCVAAEWAEEMREGVLEKSFRGMEFAVGSHLWKEANVAEELKRLQNLEIH